MVSLIFGALLALAAISADQFYIGIAIAIVTIIILLLPVEGFYDAKCVSEVKLITLRRKNVGDATFYIEQKRKKVIFAYDNRSEFALKGTAYEETSVRGKIKIYEAKDCSKPIIKKYVTKPSRLFLTFAPFSKNIQYVVHVPEGTVYNPKKKEKAFTKYSNSNSKDGETSEVEEIV